MMCIFFMRLSVRNMTGKIQIRTFLLVKRVITHDSCTIEPDILVNNNVVAILDVRFK